ncbi:MAG: biotin--[acetyl-CoA-carboxylase] ligase [Syntrophorhabdales bacterium]|jgi:BirA family biotin operon repressor/biotin-[acetyl-CoA-carboxylase] ligase
MNRAAGILAFLRAAGGQSGPGPGVDAPPDAPGSRHSGAGFVSGDVMASRLAISRTAVWKVLKQLSAMGYTIETVKGRGYRLVGAPDRLFPWEIGRFLSTRVVGREIVYRDSVDSTNALAFSLALSGCPEGTCVVAEAQSAGRGRLMRTWQSPYGKNLYLSCVLRPTLHPAQVYPLTFISCLAAYDTLRALGFDARLKWPNDVLIGSRKVSGTLIELSVEADSVRFVVIGIGVNINMDEDDMVPEIKDIATSLAIEQRKHFERARVCGMLLGGLETYYEVARDRGTDALCRLWEERAMIRGVAMEIRQMDKVHRGIAEGIGPDGAILLRENGTLTRVIAGDVSI